jgi:hypothetical protein
MERRSKRVGARRLVASLVVVCMSAAVLAVPVAAARPEHARNPVQTQGGLQQLAVQVRQLIRRVEDSPLPCETRNIAVRRLRQLNDELESGRRSAAHALLTAWMHDARSSVEAGVLGPEQGAELYRGMDEVLAKVGSGWPAKPKPTRKWKPLPVCMGEETPQETSTAAGGVVGWSYTPEVADFESNDLMIFLSSMVGMVPMVGPLLAGFTALLWPASGDAEINKLIDSKIDAAIQQQLTDDLTGLQSLVNDFLQELHDWQAPNACPEWQDIDAWSANAWCSVGAQATYANFATTYKFFLDHRPHFQSPGSEVKLLPLYAQYENLFLAFLREGVLLEPYWTATGAILPGDIAKPRRTMTIELDPDPTAEEYWDWGPNYRNYNVGVKYVTDVYKAGLAEQPSPTSDSNWETRNAYQRTMAAYVLNFRDAWKYLDPDAYPQGVPGGIKDTRMIFSDLLGGVVNWSTFKQPANVAGPLSELTIWAETTAPLRYGRTSVIEAVQSTSPPNAGPARAAAITGDATLDGSMGHTPGFIDLRERGPIVKLEAANEKSRNIFYPDPFPGRIVFTFATGEKMAIGGEKDPKSLVDAAYEVITADYPGYVLATVQAIGTFDHLGDDGATVADSMVFGFRRADSFSPSGAAISLQAGKCMDAGTMAIGTQPAIWTCHGGPNQIWHYDIGTQALKVHDTTADVLDLTNRSDRCLAATGTASGAAAVLQECDDSSPQRWTLVPSADGLHGSIRAVGSGLALDVQGGATANGTHIILYRYDGGPNQLWNLPSPLQGQLHSVGTGRCLDVSDPALPDGALIHSWRCHQPGDTHVNQLWTYDATSKVLQVAGGQKCLQTTGTTSGSQLAVSVCTGAVNQQWSLNADRTITSVQSGLAIDVAGGGTADGNRIILYPRHGGTNQQWTRPAEQGAAIHSLADGGCLDVPTWTAGTQARTAACTGSPSQRWTYHPLIGRLTAYSAIGVGGATTCLGVGSNGRAAVIGPCSDDPTQHWSVVRGKDDGVSGTIQNATPLPDDPSTPRCLSLPMDWTLVNRLTSVEVNACDPLRVTQQWVSR